MRCLERQRQSVVIALERAIVFENACFFEQFQILSIIEDQFAEGQQIERRAEFALGAPRPLAMSEIFP
jgi:hypothetical protein